MNEKNIVNDILETLSFNLKEYENYILDSSDIEVRQILQNIRNSGESFQYEIRKLAEVKGYYTSPEKVDDKKIKNVIEEFNF